MLRLFDMVADFAGAGFTNMDWKNGLAGALRFLDPVQTGDTYSGGIVLQEL
jgi:hypothetical protein